MDITTTTTTDTSAPNFKIAIAIDIKTAVIIGAAIFVAAIGALVIYKYLPAK